MTWLWKKLQGARTFIFNILSGVFIYLEASGVTGLVPPAWEPMAALFVVAGNIALRMVTTTPPLKKTS